MDNAAVNPMEREGCWLCAGSGEIEATNER